MFLRVDKMRKAPGLIASAKMYTFVLKDKNLYLILTGPGVAIDLRVSGIINQMAANTVINRGLKKIEEGEKKISESSLEGLMSEKGNFVFTPADIKNVEYKATGTFASGGTPMLLLETSKGKFKFLVTSMSDLDVLDKILQEITKK